MQKNKIFILLKITFLLLTVILYGCGNKSSNKVPSDFPNYNYPKNNL